MSDFRRFFAGSFRRAIVSRSALSNRSLSLQEGARGRVRVAVLCVVTREVPVAADSSERIVDEDAPGSRNSRSVSYICTKTEVFGLDEDLEAQCNIFSTRANLRYQEKLGQTDDDTRMNQDKQSEHDYDAASADWQYNSCMIIHA